MKNLNSIFTKKLDYYFNVLKQYIFYPFEYLYISGPRWLGCWEGLSKQDICAGLTYIPAKDFHKPETESLCDSLISRHAHAVFIGTSVIVSLLALHSFCHAWSLRYVLRSSTENKWEQKTQQQEPFQKLQS